MIKNIYIYISLRCLSFFLRSFVLLLQRSFLFVLFFFNCIPKRGKGNTKKKERKTPSKGEQKNLLPFFSNVYSTFFLLSSSFARAAAASSSRLAALETCFFKSLPLSLSFSYSLCFSPPFPLCCVFLFVDSLHK